MAVFACSDLHGRYDLFAQIRDSLTPEDKCYIIGDIFDRGPDGWKIYKEIKIDPRFILIKGNHEDMAAKGLWEYHCFGMGDYDWELWTRWNGGQVTFDAMMKDLINIPHLVKELNELPEVEEYTNIDGVHICMVHSGSLKDKIWDRRHYLYPNDKCDYDIIVHGHTPIELMLEDMKDRHIFAEDIAEYEAPGAFWYCGNHKVCLDNGSVWTGKAVMLDLDTYDEHIFIAGEKK